MTDFIKSNHFYLIIGVALAFGAGWLGRGAFIEPSAAEVKNSSQLKSNRQSDGSIITPRSQERPSTVARIPSHDASASELMAKAFLITDPAEHSRYLRGLVTAWIQDDPSLSAEEQERMLSSIESGSFRRSNGIMSDVVELSTFVSGLANPEIREAWKQAHASDLARSEIFSRFASVDVGNEHPDQLLDAAAKWTPWEQSRYRDSLLKNWAAKNPEEARAWLESNPDEFSAEAAQSLYRQLASTDFKSLENDLDSITEPQFREAAIKALASSMASNTEDAIDWANSLSSAADRDLANELIYDATPRGIGVLLRSENGFAVIHHTHRSDIGLQPQDRIVNITEADGGTVELFGQPMNSLVESIRGNPGTEATLNILRPHEDTGVLEQVEVIVTREQLFFDGKPQTPEREE